LWLMRLVVKITLQLQAAVRAMDEFMHALHAGPGCRCAHD
jgi:hypothetical protein